MRPWDRSFIHGPSLLVVPPSWGCYVNEEEE